MLSLLSQMNKIILAFAISIFYYSTIFGQDFKLTTTLEFGHVTMEDFDYQHDTDLEASAVVLFDKGESIFYINNGLDIRFHRQKRIKILQNAGLDYANITIPYYVDGYGKTEIIKDIKAKSYTLLINGQLVRREIDVDNVFTEVINSNWKQKKFAIPDVQVGTIIEYEYTLETPFKFNLPDWGFQDYIPTLHSEYTLQTVPFYEYIYIAQGITNFTNQRSFQSKGFEHNYAQVKYADMQTTYIMENVPSFVDEGYITSPDHYIMKMDFQLSKINFPRGGSSEIQTTWEKLNEDLHKHDDFGKYIKKSEPIFDDYMATQYLKSNTTAELAQSVITTIKNDFNWNGRYGKYASQKPQQLLKAKSGNAADMNLFLVSALRSSGFKAYPILLSTRNHGRIF